MDENEFLTINLNIIKIAEYNNAYPATLLSNLVTNNSHALPF